MRASFTQRVLSEPLPGFEAQGCFTTVRALTKPERMERLEQTNQGVEMESGPGIEGEGRKGTLKTSVRLWDAYNWEHCVADFCWPAWRAEELPEDSPPGMPASDWPHVKGLGGKANAEGCVKRASLSADEVRVLYHYVDSQLESHVDGLITRVNGEEEESPKG